MPIYEYRCRACDNVFEEWQKDFSERTPSCPVCQAEAHRQISNTSFILKGGGWYATEYCGKKASSSNCGGNEAKKDATPHTAKPACANAGGCASCPAS